MATITISDETYAKLAAEAKAAGVTPDAHAERVILEGKSRAAAFARIKQIRDSIPLEVQDDLEQLIEEEVAAVRRERREKARDASGT